MRGSDRAAHPHGNAMFFRFMMEAFLTEILGVQPPARGLQHSDGVASSIWGGIFDPFMSERKMKVGNWR